MKDMQANNQFLPGATGKAPKLSEYKVVTLYDPESGQIISQTASSVFEGAKTISEDELVKRAMERAAAFSKSVTKQEQKKLEASGRKLFPADRLKAKVTADPKHVWGGWRIDPKSGEFVENKGRSASSR